MNVVSSGMGGSVVGIVVAACGVIIFAERLVFRDVRLAAGRRVDGCSEIVRVGLEVSGGLGERRDLVGGHCG